MAHKKILVIEDVIEHQKIAGHALAHHEVVFATNVEEALERLRKAHFDLILLDINLPTRNGYSLLTELRSDPRFDEIPVICVTGKTEVTDKIAAFSLGAEDYLVKPFDPLELRARVDAKLKHHTNREEKLSLLKVSNLEINLSTHSVRLVDSEKSFEINLTQTEFKILACLARRPEQVFTRDQLLVSVWGESARVTDRAVDTHVCALRRKINEGKLSIRSVPGIGYKLMLSPKKSERQEAS